MKNLFVPYDLAVKLKAKGFDEPCLMVYYGEGTGPAESGQPKDKLYLPAGFGKVQNSHLKNFPEMEVYNLGQVAAPVYQQVIEWLRAKGKAVIQAATGEWQLWKHTPDFSWEWSTVKGLKNLTVDEAIDRALKMI